MTTRASLRVLLPCSLLLACPVDDVGGDEVGDTSSESGESDTSSDESGTSSESETGTETDIGTETETETDTETDTDTETESESESGGTCFDPGRIGPVEVSPLPIDPPEFFAAVDELDLLTSGDAFVDYFQAPAPPAFDDPETWGLVFSHGLHPFPRRRATVDAVAITDDCTITFDATIAVLGPSCDSFAWPVPTFAAVTMPASFDGDPGFELAAGIDEIDCAQVGVGEFEDCTIATPCAPGLICAGLTRSNGGLCMPIDQRGEFEAGALDLPIADGATLIDELEVDGLATVDTDVIVRVEIAHADPSELHVTLTNPATNEVLVWDHEPSPDDYAFAQPWDGTLILHRAPNGFSGDESVNGTWMLTIEDDAGGEAGTLITWSLEIMSRFD